MDWVIDASCQELMYLGPSCRCKTQWPFRFIQREYAEKLKVSHKLNHRPYKNSFSLFHKHLISRVWTSSSWHSMPLLMSVLSSPRPYVCVEENCRPTTSFEQFHQSKSLWHQCLHRTAFISSSFTSKKVFFPFPLLHSMHLFCPKQNDFCQAKTRTRKVFRNTAIQEKELYLIFWSWTS